MPKLKLSPHKISRKVGSACLKNVVRLVTNPLLVSVSRNTALNRRCFLNCSNLNAVTTKWIETVRFDKVWKHRLSSSFMFPRVYTSRHSVFIVVQIAHLHLCNHALASFVASCPASHLRLNAPGVEPLQPEYYR